MSEYQYYEFLAIDRPLEAEEMADLRALSTRATITPVSFTNEYNWGDFKGNPEKLMERYFDIHVYVANWMTALFMVRIPIEALTKEVLETMAASDMMDFRTTPRHWIITWYLEESEDYDRFAIDDGRGWMARLSPIRDELLRGDIRSLYVGWLAAVSREMLDEAEPEPSGVEGLGELTAAQKSLAEFLEVDEDLLAGAAMGSLALKSRKISQNQAEEWINRYPSDEVKKLLKLLLAGKGLEAERIIRNRYNAWQRSLQPKTSQVECRKVGELWKNAETAAEIRQKREEAEQKQREARIRKERNHYLKSLSMNFPMQWRKVGRILKRGSGPAYDEACTLLVALFEAYSLCADTEMFERELGKFMADHMRRKTFIQRLQRVGIWQENKTAANPEKD